LARSAAWREHDRLDRRGMGLGQTTGGDRPDCGIQLSVGSWGRPWRATETEDLNAALLNEAAGLRVRVWSRKKKGGP
jgi:hypothetical protein